MSVRLLGVNVLIAVLDSAHEHHSVAMSWFLRIAAREGWATTPITENGFIRVVSHVSYPNLRLTPAMAAGSLAQFKRGFPSVYQFWAEDISATDTTLFDLALLTGSRQITDAYLCGLTLNRGGVLATLDGAIPWRSVRGATASVVERILDRV